MNSETRKEPSSHSGSSSMKKPVDLQLLPSPGKAHHCKLTLGEGVELNVMAPYKAELVSLGTLF